jgi:hypothetical protein
VIINGFLLQNRDFTVYIVAERKVSENYDAFKYSYQTSDLKIQDMLYVGEEHISLLLETESEDGSTPLTQNPTIRSNAEPI